MLLKFLVFLTILNTHLAYAEFLPLPSGPIDIKTYQSSANERAEFAKRIERSKVIYEESGGEDSKGSLYGAMIGKLEDHSNNPHSPIYIVAPEEFAALTDYTNHSYLRINRGLRGNGEDLKQSEIAIRLIVSALNKMNPYRGIVYRSLGWGTFMSSDEVDKKFKKQFSDTHVDEKTHLGNAFLSSTKALNSLFLCAPFVYEIHSKTGKVISDFSTRPDEEEVLFQPRTTFRVLSKTTKNLDRSFCKDNKGFQNQFWISLEEI